LANKLNRRTKAKFIRTKKTPIGEPEEDGLRLKPKK